MKTTFLVSILALAFIPSCGTPEGVATAGVITSPAGTTAIEAAIGVAESTLAGLASGPLGAAGVSALQAALAPLINNLEAKEIAKVAAALTGVPKVAAANSGVLVNAITTKTTAPALTAANVAEAVPIIVNNSGGTITPTAANAAVVAALKSVAASK